MDKVVAILTRLGVDFRFEDGEVIIDDIGGTIYELNGEIGFVYGNTEPSVSVNSPLLEKWVKAYTEGNEVFGSFLRSLKEAA